MLLEVAWIVTSPVDVSVALLVALASTRVRMMASERLPDAAPPPEAETPTVVVVGTLATDAAVIEVLPEAIVASSTVAVIVLAIVLLRMATPSAPPTLKATLVTVASALTTAFSSAWTLTAPPAVTVMAPLMVAVTVSSIVL